MKPFDALYPRFLTGGVMRKAAVYFEDLQKTVFIIKTETDAGTYLEQRRWHKNDYESQPGDELSRLLEAKHSREECYEWIESRSDLMGVSVDTDQWMDREWVPVGKQT